jgi:hypothetical protein
MLFSSSFSTLGLTSAAAVAHSAREAVEDAPGPLPRDIPKGTHYWPIDKREAERLSKLLGINFESLGVRGTFVSEASKSMKDEGN